MVSKDTTPLKRLTYIARRVRLLQELVMELVRLGIARLLNIPGKLNPADVLTKYLTREDFERYISYIYNCTQAIARAVVDVGHVPFEILTREIFREDVGWVELAWDVKQRNDA